MLLLVIRYVTGRISPIEKAESVFRGRDDCFMKPADELPENLGQPTELLQEVD